MLTSFMRSPQQYMYSITPFSFSISSLNPLSLPSLPSASFLLLPPRVLISLSPSLTSLSLSLLLQRSRDIALRIDSALTFLSFLRNSSLASFCFMRLRLTPLLARLSQLCLERVFLISSSSQSPSNSLQSSLSWQGSGENPPSSSTSTSSQCCSYSFRLPFYWFICSYYYWCLKGDIPSLLAYQQGTASSLSLRNSLKHSSISECTNLSCSTVIAVSLGLPFSAGSLFSQASRENRLLLGLDLRGALLAIFCWSSREAGPSIGGWGWGWGRGVGSVVICSASWVRSTFLLGLAFFLNILLQKCIGSIQSGSVLLFEPLALLLLLLHPEGFHVVFPFVDAVDHGLPAGLQLLVLLVPAVGLLLELLLLLAELLVEGLDEAVLPLPLLLGLQEGLSVVDPQLPEVVEIVFEAAVIVGGIDEPGLSGVDHVLLPLEHVYHHLPPELPLVGLREVHLQAELLVLVQVELLDVVDEAEPVEEGQPRAERQALPVAPQRQLHLALLQLHRQLAQHQNNFKHIFTSVLEQQYYLPIKYNQSIITE